MGSAAMKITAERRDNAEVFLRSAAAGALLFRGVPMAAVAAGWELSASVGVRAGELLALIIFLLGGSAAAVAHELPEKAVHKASDIAAAAVYFCCAAGMAGSIAVKAADCAVISFSLLLHETGMRKCFLTAAASAAGMLAVFFIHQLPFAGALVPLAASLLVGSAAVQQAKDQPVSPAGLLTGGAVIMVLDMLR